MSDRIADQSELESEMTGLLGLPESDHVEFKESWDDDCLKAPSGGRGRAGSHVLRNAPIAHQSRINRANTPEKPATTGDEDDLP